MAVSGYAASPVDGSLIFWQISGQIPGRVSGQGLGRSPERAVESAAYATGVGATGKPAITLCDGVGCDGYVWKYLLPALAPHYQVVRWHYRGHGHTPPPRDRARVGIPDHADDLVCVLDKAEVERSVLVGHSMGVQVALETWRRHRDRVSGLILVCGAPGRPLSGVAGRAGEAILAASRHLTGRMPWLVNGFMRTVMPTELAYRIAGRLEIDATRLHVADFMPYLEGMARIDYQLFLDTLAAANQHTAEDVLGAVDVPTLVIGGSRDGMTSAARSEEMYRAIPGAELCIVDGGTHTAPIEYPELVCETVLDFLGRRLV